MYSDLMSNSGHKYKKQQLQTVELKVRMDCDGCEHKVKKAPLFNEWGEIVEHKHEQKAHQPL
ncbi:hypothetical protein CCACVL1_06047 [Corchorus capsularis]|uniref:HMA domain-containing protein n=1 Tax=Corchorus capsularis TaxID=210143 RepID=A0A1R3JHS9_COCAP|nr:hypothetical protein CCACVL1_06047 [Corchorus capsularis]